VSGTIRIGIGGWIYPAWRKAFYPAGLPAAQELAYAAGRLTAIEINGTFYRTPAPDTVARWKAEVPEGFRFAVKGPRHVGSRRELTEAADGIRHFAAAVAPLGDRLGPINWQLPPTKVFRADEIAGFLDLLPQGLGDQPLMHAIEARHPSFDDPAFVELARARSVAIVRAADGPYPSIEADTAPFIYARIMGTDAGEAEGYSPAALDRWAAQAQAWAEGGRDVWLFVIGGAKARNPFAALALIKRLGADQ
jgi:uncharacterized protein YecE (DUF72 family)